MSRLEEIKKNKQDYQSEIGIDVLEDISWLIQQAERVKTLEETLTDTWYSRTSKKLGELNKFLQKRDSKGIGDNVIDVAMSHIRKQDYTIMEQESERRNLIERINRYKQALEFYADRDNWEVHQLTDGVLNGGNIVPPEYEPAWAYVDEGEVARRALEVNQ